MKIAVNTRLLLKGRIEGIGRFSHEILRRLVRLMPEHQFVFLFDRDYDEDFIYADNVSGLVVPPQARHPLLYQLWFEYALPRALERMGADLFFSPEGYLPLRSNVPSVNVMHDINFEHHPEWVPPFHRWHFRRYFPRYAKKAERIITVSEFSRGDIAERYGISRDKIDLVYNGVSDAFRPLDDFEQGKIRAELSDGAPYFIYVGSLQARKNIARLLEAFDRFKSMSDSAHRLLIVGQRKHGNEALDKAFAAMKHAKDVIFTGRLEDDEMIAALASAEAMVYIPLFEGFGIPVIESFSCGVPAIVSNLSALPEVAGESAIQVDPHDVVAIAGAMQDLAQDEARRLALAQSGIERAKAFDWNTSAAQIKDILMKAAHG